MPAESLKTVERTLALLNLFSREVPEMSVAELVRRAGMPRAVVHRILVTLEREHFLQRCPDSLRYRIGVTAFQLGALHLSQNPLIQVSRDILGELAQETGFPVYLGTRVGAEISILALHEGRMPIRFVWSPGDRLPIATTALGKAMLMHLDDRALDRLIGQKELPALSEHSLRSRADLDAQLRAHAEQGWIPAFEESFPGVYAVGSAVLSAAGEPVAGVSVSFLRNQSEKSQVESIGNLVRCAAKTISDRMITVAAYGTRTGPNS